MTIPAATPGAQPRSLWRSTVAVLIGFVTVVVLSLGTDQVLHWLGGVLSRVRHGKRFSAA